MAHSQEEVLGKSSSRYLSEIIIISSISGSEPINHIIGRQGVININLTSITHLDGLVSYVMDLFNLYNNG